jgi:ferredoxin
LDGHVFDFTAADFAACDRRFYGHFALVEEQKECMSTLSDWLMSSNGRVPFIVVVDHEGNRRFAVMTRHAAALAATAADSWSRIRELGGIENSHVRTALESETARLQEEKKRALEEADAKFSEELERAATGVAEEIVSSIAAGLLHLNGSARPARTPKPVAIPKSVAEATEEVVEVPAEEEDELSMDEAYIDTPLCTSCNECTNLNSLIFGYNADKQAYVKDAAAGPYADLVKAAELCPVHIVHPGRPKNPAEAGIDELLKRAQPFL